MHDLDVIPGIGIGRARFGMVPAEVEAALDRPQDGSNWLEGNLNGWLLYPGFRLGFSGCSAARPHPSDRFFEMVARPDSAVRLFGRPLRTWTKADFLERCRREGYEPTRRIYEPVEAGIEEVGIGKEKFWLSIDFEADGQAAWLEMFSKRCSDERGG